MKVYNYDPHDKFFISQTDAVLDPIANNPVLPAFATFIAPPRDLPEGMIPIFNGVTWDVVKDNFWRPEYQEVNYYSGRDTSDIPILPAISELSFGYFPSIPRMMSSALFGIRFINRIELINSYILSVFEKHNSYMQKMISPLQLIQYKTEIEIIIYLIKKSLDDLVTMYYIKLYIEDVKANHEIKIQSIGDLINKKGDHIEAVKEAINYDKYVNFFMKLNDLHNSQKHDLFLSETDMLIGTDFPTVIAIRTNKGNFEKPKYHNHSLGQFIISFSDFLFDNMININIK